VRLIDWVPLGTDVDVASQADLGPCLDRIRRVILVVTVDRCDQRGSSVRLSRNRRGRCRVLRCDGDLICLSRAPCQSQVGLLEILNVKLQGVETTILPDNFIHWVDCGLGRRVLLTPDSSRHDAALSVDRNDVVLVTTRAFDWGDLKSQNISSLVAAFDVNRCAALVTVHASSAVFFAGFAHFSESRLRNEGHSLTWSECLGFAKLDFGRPNSTGNMNPVVVGSPLQGFPGIHRAIHLFLFLAVIFGHL